MKDKTVEAILSNFPNGTITSESSANRMLVTAIVKGLKDEPITSNQDKQVLDELKEINKTLKVIASNQKRSGDAVATKNVYLNEPKRPY